MSMYEKILSIKTKFMGLLYTILLFSIYIIFVNVHLFWKIKNIAEVRHDCSESH